MRLRRAYPHPRGARTLRARAAAAACALALGAAAALLVSCGSSGKGLIPVANAGPLQRDFEAVARAAETANGSCAGTEAAIARTEGDFASLPSSVDAGLRRTLLQGIDNLRSRALALCAQPLSTGTTSATTSTSPTGTTPTTPTTTQPTTETQTAPPATTTVPSGPGGGAVAPGEEAPPAGGGGTGAGEGGAGGGQEGGR